MIGTQDCLNRRWRRRVPGYLPPALLIAGQPLINSAILMMGVL